MKKARYTIFKDGNKITNKDYLYLLCEILDAARGNEEHAFVFSISNNI